MAVRKTRWLLAALLVILGASLLPAACADPAPDITKKCRFYALSARKNFSRCTDRDYKTYWRSGNGDGAGVEVTVPEGQTASGVEVQWYEHPHAWGVQVQDESGAWRDAGHSEGAYLTDYLPLPEGTTFFRVTNAPGEKRHFNLMELRIYGAGEIPPEVHRWEPPAEKADLMLLVAHSDDEVLWFGGALPTYAGQEGKAVQVCMLVPSMPYRRLELLDCLWHCGVKNYPVWGGFRDVFSYSLAKQYKKWNKNHLYQVVTGWIRRFKPDVLLTHDLQGEYGHGAHRACADSVMKCLDLAADDKKYPASAKDWGTWDVPKCYILLWKENVVDIP